jgi:hypothetical protein
MAPGHGMEDWLVCTQQRHRTLPVLCPVDEAGRFTSEAETDAATPFGFTGLPVLTAGTARVIEILKDRNALVHHEVRHAACCEPLPPLSARQPLKHRYPYDWRTNKPVIYRSTPQWFLKLDSVKEQGTALAQWPLLTSAPAAEKALADVEMIPASGRQRLQSFVGTRTEWWAARGGRGYVPTPRSAAGAFRGSGTGARPSRPSSAPTRARSSSPRFARAGGLADRRLPSCLTFARASHRRRRSSTWRSWWSGTRAARTAGGCCPRRSCCRLR